MHIPQCPPPFKGFFYMIMNLPKKFKLFCKKKLPTSRTPAFFGTKKRYNRRGRNGLMSSLVKSVPAQKYTSTLKTNTDINTSLPEKKPKNKQESVNSCQPVHK